MATLRKLHNAGAVAIPWATAQDERLSFTARGVLAYVLSLPDGWEYSIPRIAASCTAKTKGSGREAVTSAMRELEDAGYRRVVTERDERGQLRRWAEFSFLPVPEWAETAAAERHKRSHKNDGACVQKADDRAADDRATETRNMARTGETPGGTVNREPAPRQAEGTREFTTERNTHDDEQSVCVAPEHLERARGILGRTVHPDAAARLAQNDRDRLIAAAADLIARGWTTTTLERRLAGRTNAATHSPEAILTRVLTEAATETPPATGGADVSAARLKHLRTTALDAAGRLDISDAELGTITARLHKASAAELQSWLEAHAPARL